MKQLCFVLLLKIESNPPFHHITSFNFTFLVVNLIELFYLILLFFQRSQHEASLSGIRNCPAADNSWRDASDTRTENIQENRIWT